MSLFSEKMPQWDNTGTEPSSTKKTNGWGFKEKPPFEFFNWLFNRIYKCIQEIRTVTDTQVTNINSELAAKASEAALAIERERIDGIVTSAGDYYIKCLSTDTGALLVVASGATTGQINLASVSPKLDTYIPVAGDYVRLVSNGLTAELIDIRVGADGKTDASAGIGVRRQFNSLKNDLNNLNITVSDITNLGETTNYDMPITLTTKKSQVLTVVNNGTPAGYFTLTLYINGNVTSIKTNTVLLNGGESISLTVPKAADDTTSMFVRINNPNNNAKRITVKISELDYVDNSIDEIKTSKADKADIDAIRDNIFYISKSSITSYYPSTKTINTGLLAKDGLSKLLQIKNNTTSDGFFTVTVYDSSGNTVYTNTSSAVLISAGSDTVINLGDAEVNQIVVNNTNGLFNYKVNVYNVLGRKSLYVGSTRKIKKFTEGLTQAVNAGNVDLYVDAETFDIVSELTEAYMSEITAAGYYGPLIGRGVHLHLASGAKLVCHYQGTDPNVMQRFSVLNAIESDVIGASDFAIYGGDFDCSRIRYVIHDECNGHGQYTHEYHDCKMKLDNTNNSAWTAKCCIGGGLGRFSKILIDGGEYNGVGITNTIGNDAVISYHQPQSGFGNDFINKVIINNIYCDTGTCIVSVLGDSTNMSDFICSNSSMTKKPYVNGLDNPTVNHNFQMKEWNNEVRS